MRAGSFNSPSAPIRLTPETFGSVQTKRFVYHLVTANIFILDSNALLLLLLLLPLNSPCSRNVKWALEKFTSRWRLPTGAGLLCCVLPFDFHFHHPKDHPPLSCWLLYFADCRRCVCESRKSASLRERRLILHMLIGKFAPRLTLALGSLAPVDSLCEDILF